MTDDHADRETTSSSLSDLQSTVSDLVARHDSLALCLDFDGTLAPIVSEPDDAAILPETRTYVTSLAEHPDVDVAVISGRALEDVRSRVDVSGIDYAGNHGLEVQQDGDERVHPAVERHRDALERTSRRLSQRLEPLSGCFVEDKYATATVHYRQADPEDARRAVDAAERAVEHEDGLRITPGDEIVEIRPDVDRGKGVAVRMLVDPGPDTVTTYLGDDRTDVDAFRALAEMESESVCVAVRDDLPDAEYRLEGPAEVRSFLRWLVDELDAA